MDSLICDIAAKCGIALKLGEIGVDASALPDIIDSAKVNGAILSCARNISKAGIGDILDEEC